MKCTVVYDNEKGGGLESGWGFSAYIEAHGKKILFDTGDSGAALLGNMKKLSIDPRGLDIVFISHAHADHAGGLENVLRLQSGLKLYLPPSASSIGAAVRGMAQVVYSDGPAEISKGIWTTGELANIEQSLVVSTAKGNVVLCGCSHPGLENILDKARAFGPVYGAIGGFHGFAGYDALKGLRLVVPCHCTLHKAAIAERFPDSCRACGGGLVIEV